MSGDSMFKNVEITANYIIITMLDGTQVKIPTWKAFEDLQTIVNQVNSNLSALQTIVSALQNNDYVTSVTPLLENGKEIGYRINFSKSGAVTIYHGQDGKDGYSPVIGAKQDTDGKYYWTLDGEWMTDENGNKIPFDVKVGDIVLTSRYGGTEVKVDGKEYKVVNQDDILAIVG